MEGLLQPTQVFFFILLIPLIMAGGAFIAFLAVRATRQPTSGTNATPARRLNMPEETERQAILDEEHLKLLSWGYMVSGGMAAMVSLFALLYLIIGLGMAVAFSKVDQSAAKPGEMPPVFIGYFLCAIGLGLFLTMVAVAIVKFLAARNLMRRKGKTFCMVIAAITCLEFPYGTFLGVVTFIVLARQSVARLFEPKAA
jgi:hypothetical protein